MQMKTRTIVVLACSAVLLIIAVSMMGSLIESVDAGEVVVMQDPVDGDLHFWKAPGLYYQNFGKTTHYKKSFQFWFSNMKDQGQERDQSIQVRFNDGGHANISGSLRVDLPLDDENLRKIHTKYGSQEAIEHQLIRTIMEKAVYMSGPLMSSKESYAERRSDLIAYIEDQVTGGVYKSEVEYLKEIDPISGKEKTVTKVKLVKDEKGLLVRQEPSALIEYGIRVYNLAINNMPYDATVEKQIQAQQQAVMEVQTAMAEARKAEQRAITAEKEGQANAAKAKWEQEVVKAKAVTEAEQQREVARLNMEAAGFTKKQEILLGEGESERRKLVMQADGALDKKLAAYTEVMKAFAAEWAKQRWVPEVQIGDTGGGPGGNNAATNLLQLLQVKTARDLALDMSVPNTPAAPRR